MQLLQVLTNEPPSEILEPQIQQPNNNKSSYEAWRQRRLNFALHLIAAHPAHFPVAHTISVLPSTTLLQADFLTYFKSQLRIQDQEQRTSSILTSLGIAEQFQLRLRLKGLQSTRVIITDTSTCSHCLKRIGRNVAFAVLPGKSRPIHLSCWQRRRDAEQRAPKQTTSTSLLSKPDTDVALHI